MGNCTVPENIHTPPTEGIFVLSSKSCESLVRNADNGENMFNVIHDRPYAPTGGGELMMMMMMMIHDGL